MSVCCLHQRPSFPVLKFTTNYLLFLLPPESLNFKLWLDSTTICKRSCSYVGHKMESVVITENVSQNVRRFQYFQLPERKKMISETSCECTSMYRRTCVTHAPERLNVFCLQSVLKIIFIIRDFTGKIVTLLQTTVTVLDIIFLHC
jgi:hypothetical protein